MKGDGHGRCRLVHADDCENAQRAHIGTSEDYRPNVGELLMGIIFCIKRL